MAQTPAERRKAQRKLAKQVKEGTYEPSRIGEKAREKAREYRQAKTAFISYIRAYKDQEYGYREKFSQQRSDQVVRFDPGTGKERKIEQLRRIADHVEQLAEDELDFWMEVDLDTDYESAFYYH